MGLQEVKRTISIVVIVLGCALLFVPFVYIALGPFSIGLDSIEANVLLFVGGLIAVGIGFMFKLKIGMSQRKEAYKLLLSNLDNFKQRSYKELKQLMIEPVKIQAKSSSGKFHMLKFEGFWKNVEGGDLRVIGSFDPDSGNILAKDWVEFTMSQDGILIEEDHCIPILIK